MLLGGPEWSLEQHAAALPSFQAAARTLLLVNRWRGFPGAGEPVTPAAAPGCSSAVRRSRRVRQRSAAASAHTSRVSVEPEVLLSILRTAAADVEAWLAAAQRARPFIVPRAARRGG